MLSTFPIDGLFPFTKCICNIPERLFCSNKWWGLFLDLFLFNTFLIAIYFLNFIYLFILCFFFFLLYLIKMATKLRYLTRKCFGKDTHSSDSSYLFKRILPIRIPKLILSRSSIPQWVLLPNIFCTLDCRLNSTNSYVISRFWSERHVRNLHNGKTSQRLLSI